MGDTSLTRRGFLAVSAAGLGAAALSACGSSDDKGSDGKTIEWWNIITTQPGKRIWAARCKEFEKANPGVTVKIVTLENDSYKAKMTALTASGKLPDIYHTWGGGVLKQQIDAGLVEDITEKIAPWSGGFMPATMTAYQFDSKTYANPFDIGCVGFWYNKAHFAKAGITTPPTTWTAYLDAVKKLKAAGITPIALGGKEKWPGMYYWAYLAMRVAGLDAMQKASTDKDFTGEGFVKAGEHLKELVDLQPFQTGFLGATYSQPGGEAAAMSNGKAAMELMGQWAPITQQDQGKGIGKDLGFFSFPAVEGGAGKLTEVFGGGGGMALRKGAPQTAVDFLKFMSDVDFGKKLVTEAAAVPVLKDAQSALTDPNLKMVTTAIAGATGFQLYLDQAYAPAVGQEINDSVAALIAGSKSPEAVTKSITQVAKSQ
ncbi:extracellular solute-binding protein [Streptomyces sp. NPDC050738]|uniref:extracellular solute-binding protein n=1 Tax=Streptomyces sp. NPDC050738 TaxID=3154744 RepID=UPI00343C8F6D